MERRPPRRVRQVHLRRRHLVPGRVEAGVQAREGHLRLLGWQHLRGRLGRQRAARAGQVLVRARRGVRGELRGGQDARIRHVALFGRINPVPGRVAGRRDGPAACPGEPCGSAEPPACLHGLACASSPDRTRLHRPLRILLPEQPAANSAEQLLHHQRSRGRGGGLPATLAAVKLPPSVAAVHAAGYVVDRDVIGQAERGGAEAGGLAQRRRQNRQDPGGERGGAGREPAARGRDRAHGRRPSLLARTGEGVEPRTRRVVRANRGGAKHRWMGLRHPPAPLPQLGGRARVAPHVDHHVPQLIRQRPHLAPRDERPPEVGRGQLQGPIADSPRPERRIECEMGPPRDG
mmetsp:Transcript_6715/g.15775  ORF Transcript_6715/g.15775 Transcript_6715/m.15775 type:complete len:347 (+) Transcript_6715:793-1833(+)